MEFINLKLEKTILRCIMYDKDVIIKLINKGTIQYDVFADKSIRQLCKMIVTFFLKHGKLITLDLLKLMINRMIIKNDKKDKKVIAKLDIFKEKMLAVTENVLENVKPDKSELEHFLSYYDELVVLYNGRKIQKLQIDVLKHIDDGDIEEANKMIQSFNSVVIDEGIDKGEYTEDFGARENEVLKKVANKDMFQLLSTGIEHLDIALEGGFDKELVIISGHSNMGKSTLVQQLATNAYRMKKNIVFLTIGEMSKTNVQNRIDCNLANIDFKFFRNPIKNYDKEIHKQWKEKIESCKDKYGKLQIIGFRKEAAVEDILAKVYETMHIWNKPIHGIFVDSINNISSGRNAPKDWQDYEPICWKLFLITKDFHNADGSMGIPLVATYQLKKANKEVSSDFKGRALREDDVAFSPYPYHYSEVFIGMKECKEKERMELQIMKGRGIAKLTGLFCYPNPAFGRFHDTAKQKEFENSVPQEELDNLKEMEVSVEDDS